MTGLGIAFACLVFATTDGDTFRCRTADDAKAFSVRIWGINSRERDEPGYKEARENLQSLVLRQVLDCEAMDINSSRIVAKCERIGDRLDPAAEQVRAGYATDCPKFSGGAFAPLEQPGTAHAAFCEPNR